MPTLLADDARIDVARTDVDTLADLRKARRRRRLGDVEWFDVAYRAYLFALVGGALTIMASDAVGGLLDEGVERNDLLTRGPAVAAVAVVAAVAIGLRNGADGGPVSVERADVRHLLLSPIDRRRALLRPIVQRLRSVAFTLALPLGVVGQLIARDVDGSRVAWAASAALFGALVGALYVAAAVLAHALRLQPWSATAIGTVLVAWQIAVAVAIWTSADEPGEVATELESWQRIGPANTIGSVLFWSIRQRGVDAIAIGVVLAIVVVALALGGRLRLEPLERRGQLVSQLRFAATLQDIRTVVQLRRQLRAESVRTRPWFTAMPRPHRTETPKPARIIPARESNRTRFGDFDDEEPGARDGRRGQGARGAGGGTVLRLPGGVVWRRGTASIARIPTARFARMAALAALGGAAASWTVSSTPLAAIGLVVALFLVGLESVEPLAQEVDRPDLTDRLPVDRGRLFAHHLVAPAVLLGALGLIGAVGAVVVEPEHTIGALALAVPVVWGGAIGAIVTTVRDAPDPPSVASTTVVGRDRLAESPMALPEFAGISNTVTGLMPIVLSAIGSIPVFAMRLEASVSSAVRATVAVALCLAMLLVWIIRRDRWSLALRRFFTDGRAMREAP
ncbi:MAG: hypothetical protein AAFP84_06930 [Actinomycetota bacterium]